MIKGKKDILWKKINYIGGSSGFYDIYIDSAFLIWSIVGGWVFLVHPMPITVINIVSRFSLQKPSTTRRI